MVDPEERKAKICKKSHNKRQKGPKWDGWQMPVVPYFPGGVMLTCDAQRREWEGLSHWHPYSHLTAHCGVGTLWSHLPETEKSAHSGPLHFHGIVRKPVGSGHWRMAHLSKWIMTLVCRPNGTEDVSRFHVEIQTCDTEKLQWSDEAVCRLLDNRGRLSQDSLANSRAGSFYLK